MKIADYGKAITSYIESPTKEQKNKIKKEALMLQDTMDAIQPGRSLLSEGTPKKKPFTLDQFKNKANLYMAAYQNNALPVDDIRLKLDEYTRQGIEDGTFTADEAIKVVKDLKFYYRDLAQKQRLRGVVEGIGTVDRKDLSEGSKKYDYKNPLQKNQYVMRTDEEIQAIIDDPKYKNYTRKDFRNEGILTRKETERTTLKFKNFGKQKKKPENIENVKRDEKIKKTQGSNISVKGSGQTGKQFSHVFPLIESAKPGTKTTFTIDASMNRKLEPYNKIGQAIAEAQEKLILEKPDGYKKELVKLNARAKKNVMNAIKDLGKEYKGQIGYFQVDPETGQFKNKAGNYKMSFAGIEGENKIFKDMTGKERKDFERKISAIEKAKTIPGVTTADKIDRPEKAKLLEKFRNFGKPISKIALRAVSPFIPIVGTAGTLMGMSDVAEASTFTKKPDELGIAYLAGPEVARNYGSFKESIRGKADETEEFVP